MMSTDPQRMTEAKPCGHWGDCICDSADGVNAPAPQRMAAAVSPESNRRGFPHDGGGERRGEPVETAPLEVPNKTF